MLSILSKHSLKELKFLNKIPDKNLGLAKQHSCFGNALVESLASEFKLFTSPNFTTLFTFNDQLQCFKLSSNNI